ncbi:MAG: acetate--CoA ligase [Rhodospirillaceae bacterium]
MNYDVIRKSPGSGINLADYAATYASFKWSEARALVQGLPGGGMNIAYECLDRHVADGLGAKIAIRWQAKSGSCRAITYADLQDAAARFAGVIRHLEPVGSCRVFSLLGRVPELFVAALGTLRAGGVFSPLFSAFGPEPIRARLELGSASVLVTTADFYVRKVAPSRAALPNLRHILIVDADGVALPSGTQSLTDLMAAADHRSPVAPTRPDDMALLHFTSGTTGRPKGVVHVHDAIVAHKITGRFALDMQADDIFWCTADPGWVTGTSYGIIAPLANGLTLIVDEQEFDAERWYATLEREKVSIWYTAPTAIRMLMKAGDALIKRFDLSSVRFMASVGEPLNAEAVVWSRNVFGKPFHDNWWQTETGGIMISNFAAMDVKPGSMGRPLPGIEAAIIRRTGTAPVEVIEAADTVGELALRQGWPSMMRGYLNEDERYRKCFSGGWYLSGDLAMRDRDGYYWFVGRSDDVIKSSGHLIGPFEVESALMEHPAVAEAAVIGIPEPTAGEVVKAFVSLRDGFTASEALRKELLGQARKRLGPAIAPRDIAFRSNLPKTRSGKIMRRLLRARELGLPEGDISTLESDEK